MNIKEWVKNKYSCEITEQKPAFISRTMFSGKLYMTVEALERIEEIKYKNE